MHKEALEDELEEEIDLFEEVIAITPVPYQLLTRIPAEEDTDRRLSVRLQEQERYFRGELLHNNPTYTLRVAYW
jgi:hypothetical protein